MPPAGFEPAHTAPEADALSPELRGLGTTGGYQRPDSVEKSDDPAESTIPRGSTIP